MKINPCFIQIGWEETNYIFKTQLIWFYPISNLYTQGCCDFIYKKLDFLLSWWSRLLIVVLAIKVVDRGLVIKVVDRGLGDQGCWSWCCSWWSKCKFLVVDQLFAALVIKVIFMIFFAVVVIDQCIAWGLFAVVVINVLFLVFFYNIIFLDSKL